MVDINHIDFRRFDLNLMVAFDALMVTRSVTGAAERVGIGQPAMSHALQRLRERFDDPLFLRTPKGLEPTARAWEVSEPIAEALRQVQLALTPPEVFVPATAERTLRLATQDYGAMLLVPLLLAHLQQCAPKLTVVVRQAPPNACLAALDRGEVDVVLGECGDLPNRLVGFAALEDSVVVIARRDHPQLLGRQALDLATYKALSHLVVSPEGQLQDAVDEALAEEGHKRRVVATVPHLLAVPFTVARSELVATLSRRTAELWRDPWELALFAPPLALPSVAVSVVLHRRSESDVAVQWFAQEILALCRR
ncbi:MAG: LysR family transcriptional regulator [Candidatus Competibacterales bacterium]